MDSCGEILLQEKCNPSAQKIYYVKPAGILATQAVLKGVGVGDTTATPLAATITWVLKDGCGHLGRILFAYSHGSYLDSYCKKWRLYADVLNDLAMCIEISLPVFHNYTTNALCISTVMKSIVGVAGGATRVAMTQHHAIRGNMGDVSAKDSAQETAVNLIASITALLILSLLGSSLVIFVVMMSLHMLFNYFAVRAVCLATLNEPRFMLLIERYLKREVIATPSEINSLEPIIFYQLGSNLLDLKICGFQMKLGQSLQHIVQYSPEASYLKTIKKIYSETQYIIIPNMKKRIMHVFIKENATVNNILRAYFHAVLLATTILEIAGDSLIEKRPSRGLRPFAKVRRTLQQAEWSRTGSKRSLKALYEPPFELLTYVCNMATKEWPHLKTGLLRTGWDLSKHQLIVDEWRVTSDVQYDANHPEHRSPEKIRLFKTADVHHSTRKPRNLRESVFMQESISPVNCSPSVSTPSTSHFEHDVSIDPYSISDTTPGWFQNANMNSVDSTESGLMRETPSTSSDDEVSLSPQY
ncbi:RUS family member 1 isoform X2 [Maniola jurtina]|uniref:RUS family member 1 isoform X2 n=1 Tax=Maniola jurtina TaxID=191418 RepID=UPI001E688586|nr:RUS family member 1 isoform X2 [Maniola jurtina]